MVSLNKRLALISMSPPEKTKNDIQSQLMSLSDFQEFLITELRKVEGEGSRKHILSPLSDALGLESPSVRSMDLNPPKNLQDALRDDFPKLPPQKEEPKHLKFIRDETPAFSLTDLELNRPPLERELSPIRKQEKRSKREEKEVTEPSDISKLPASLLRRVQAGLIDQVFVAGSWIFLMLLASKLLWKGGASEIFLETIARTFGQNALSVVATSYFLIWLSYLTVAIGLLDMTIGMWVWDLRIGYHGIFAFERIKRIFFTLVFHAPLFPALGLLVQPGGRNLIDRFSSSFVYRLK